MNIRLYNYNNYYNRQVKHLETTSPEYSDYIYEIQNANWNPNDNIETEHIFGSASTLYDGEADYAVCIKDNTIVSRWFVLDNIRTKGGQWHVRLKRDVVADYYNIIVESPCFVEKGYVDNSNILIYNNENVSFNQIKKKEIPLENNIKTPWLVAYLSRWHTEAPDPDKPEETITVYNSFSGSFVDDSDIVPDYVLDSLDDYKYKSFSSESTSYIYTDDFTFLLEYQKTDKRSDYWGITKTGYYNAFAREITNQILPSYLGPDNPIFRDAGDRDTIYSYLVEQFHISDTIDSTTGLTSNSIIPVGTISDFYKLQGESNKIIKAGNKYYRIISHVSNSQYSFDNDVYVLNKDGSFGNKIFNGLTEHTEYEWNIPNGALVNPKIRIPFTNTGIYFTYQEITPGKKVNYHFTYSNNITLQSPYEIIAAPLNDVVITHNNNTYYHNGSIALSWFLDLGQKNASGLVYDVQIVPYCPVDTLDWSNYKIISCYGEDIKDGLAWAVKLPTASFTTAYQLDLDIEPDYKILVNCDLYRFCSPNGVGNFDFNPAKNGGFSGYEVDCTLMPYNPYIKINPLFDPNYLYGGDYNDYRGLICGGDFSLPITTNQWETYQINNKYYQQNFQREIDALEINNNWARGEAWTKVFTGSAAGAAGGALVGASAGGGVGAIGGAIAGGVASLAGGIVDLVKTYQLQEENMDLMKDKFAYSLRTIQARPNTLARTTAYNINNKYFPYIEYYTCKDEEKELFKQKIKYDGMTIMAIGKISDYIGPNETFVKGTLIRLPNLQDDTHVAEVIRMEINKGVYI